MARDQKSLLERAFRQNERVLVLWLIKKLGDAESAHDVAQSAFMNVWQFSQTNKIENPKALLFKTAANLALNELRRRKRFFRRNVLTNEPIEVGPLRNKPSLDPTPEEATSLRQEARVLLAAIDQLPEKPKIAYKLNRFEEMSYKQIAEKLGVSVSSVEKYMIEALSILRKIILPDAIPKPRGTRTPNPSPVRQTPSQAGKPLLVLANNSDKSNE